ncbi:MAG: hypothetical protein FXF54_04490 [Kosmotoga sp.]|nr:MAG: hypothetical protein FXF54_04490 [Kosmotoga sp.]
MKKLIILALLVLTTVAFAVKMPVQPILWYNVDEWVEGVKPAERADLIRMLVYRNLDPIINFTNYDIWLNNEPFAKYDIDEPITKAEVMTMFVKYLGLERKAIEEYPGQAPYDNTIKTEYENVYKGGFDTTRIWGYSQVLTEASTSLQMDNIEENLTKAEFIKYLVDAFVVKNPDYAYLTDKVKELSGKYAGLSFDKELAAYIYIFENYFLVPAEDKAEPMLTDSSLYSKSEVFTRTYEDVISREEAYALFARVALAEFKKAKETGLLVPVRDIQNVISYKAEYDGQLVFEEVTTPDVNVSNVEVYDYDRILKIWEEKHKNDADFKTKKEEFEKKLAKLGSVAIVETEEGNSYLLLGESKYWYHLINPPEEVWEGEGTDFATFYQTLPDEAGNEEVVHEVDADVKGRVKENYTVHCDELDKEIDVSGVKANMSIYYPEEEKAATVVENVDVFPHELLSFYYKETTKWTQRKEIDKTIFADSQVALFPVSARILYSGETMTVGKLKEFVNSFGKYPRSSDDAVLEVISTMSGYVDIFELLGVSDEVAFVGKAKFSNELSANKPVVTIENAELRYNVLGKLVSAKFYEVDNAFFTELLTEIEPNKIKLTGTIYGVVENEENGSVVTNNGLKDLFLAEGPHSLVTKLSGDYTLFLERHEDDENITDYFLRVFKE